MDTRIPLELETRLVRLKETYDVTVSEQAKVILGDCITAITVDAHSSWPDRVKSSLSTFQTDMLDALPSTLANMASEKRLTEITSFDLLHSMSRIVDHICPLVKPPP